MYLVFTSPDIEGRERNILGAFKTYEEAWRHARDAMEGDVRYFRTLHFSAFLEMYDYGSWSRFIGIESDAEPLPQIERSN